jgi:hypothetical protein
VLFWHVQDPGFYPQHDQKIIKEKEKNRSKLQKFKYKENTEKSKGEVCTWSCNRIINQFLSRNNRDQKIIGCCTKCAGRKTCQI